ncbi:MAG: (d)CMP kinase, partial [Silvanigrellaceae bacterium]|nr:(d)CMP kinase [Silvanigrellaceae bacterium]
TGTVVFPHAPLKIFLTASAEARAERRRKELLQQGKILQNKEILKEIYERDERDQSRQHSPLKSAEDAIIIDSTHLSAIEISKIIVNYSHERKLSNP